jgi:hypothetical protein
MDLKPLAREYLWPAAFAVASALVTYVTSGAELDMDGVLKTAGAAAMAFFLTRFNPKAGKDQPWMAPKDGAEKPEA